MSNPSQDAAATPSPSFPLTRPFCIHIPLLMPVMTGNAFWVVLTCMDKFGRMICDKRLHKGGEHAKQCAKYDRQMD